MNRAPVRMSIFFIALIITIGCQTLTSQEFAPPKLAVVIVVDQMRADYLSRFAGLYKSGFKRLLNKGAVFTNAHYDYANTETGPGHATISTGSHPSRHGIVANAWFDRIEKRQGAFGYGQDSRYPLVGYPDEAPEAGRAPTK